MRRFTPVINAERDRKPDLQTGVRLDCIDDSDVRSGREDGRIPVSRQTPWDVAETVSNLRPGTRPWSRNIWETPLQPVAKNYFCSANAQLYESAAACYVLGRQTFI